MFGSHKFKGDSVMRHLSTTRLIQQAQSDKVRFHVLLEIDEELFRRCMNDDSEAIAYYSAMAEQSVEISAVVGADL